MEEFKPKALGELTRWNWRKCHPGLRTSNGAAKARQAQAQKREEQSRA